MADDDEELLTEDQIDRIMRTGGDAELIPAVRLRPDVEPEPKKRVPLFYLGTGEDEIEYSVEVPVSPGVGLRYLRLLATKGEGVAAAWIITQLVGEDAFEALIDYESLTEQQFNQVLARAIRITQGPRDRPKVNSRMNGGRGRSKRSG